MFPAGKREQQAQWGGLVDASLTVVLPRTPRPAQDSTSTPTTALKMQSSWPTFSSAVPR